MKKKLKYKTVYVEDVVPGNPTFSKKALKEIHGIDTKYIMTYPEMTYAQDTNYVDENGIEVVNFPGDGIYISLQEHPRPKQWYKRLWIRIETFFIRPKFSEGALEPAEELTISKEPLEL